MNIEEIRQSLSEPDAISLDPFGLLREIAAQVAREKSEVSQELVLRALENRDRFNPFGEVLNALVREMGLFPYLEASTLSDRDLLAYEFHRPLDLGDDVVFHEVQARVYRELLGGRNVILSAPTSFGKSLIIDALVASRNYRNIVIVVPTIALIDETRRRLSRFSDNFKIITHVSQQLADRNIFILTQERVIDHDELPQVDLFVVDEFYKLSPSLDQERSALLNQAFYKLLKTGAQFYLLGPDIRDLPSGLPDRLECLYVRTDYNTVISETHRITAKDEREELVRLCREMNDLTLIYCRSPKRVREVAKWLIEAEIDGSPAGLEQAVDWMGREYHADWLAAKALDRGIALHHGKLPRALSQYMVRTFNEGRCRFLICTSTLIEGVNTKAKNVIVFDNTVALRKYDYFTFNNIRGRSGRMFEHFIGRVYLFHEPPQRELPLVDVPALTQPPETPTSLLVQIEEVDLVPRSRDRLRGILEQDDLDIGVIRRNSGVDPEQQVTLARDIRADAEGVWSQLRWTGMPTYRELEFACETFWNRLRSTTQGKAGVFSARQLAYRINQFRSNPEIPDLIRIELDNPRKPSPDDAVETVLDFVRQWASFDFPRLLMALDRIQRSVYESLGRPHGDYTVFAGMVEGLMMKSPLAALDEYGVPIQTARKLEPALEPEGDLDAVLERLRNLDRSAIEIHPFERELLSDAQRYL